MAPITLNFKLTLFKLTVQFDTKKILTWVWINRPFVLPVFELAGFDL